MSVSCFEVSWEIANPVGGIHTVIASKAEQMRRAYGDRYLVVGPWLNWMPKGEAAHQDRAWEDGALDPAAMKALAGLESVGVRCRTGHWKVPGRPAGLLVDFQSLWAQKDRLLTELWERYGLDSYSAPRDYEEPVLFGLASGMVVEALARDWLLPARHQVLCQVHEWLAGSAVLRLKHALPEVACVFTTHATALGRSLASRAHLPEEPLGDERARALAAECGVSAKHSMEYVAARAADGFTTVSDTTAVECERILGIQPLITPNALQPNYPPGELRSREGRARARQALFKIASEVTGVPYPGARGAASSPSGDDPLIVITSGRYEFRNKGLDLVAEALEVVQSSLGPARSPRILAFYLVPAGSRAEAPVSDREKRRLSHALENPDGDPILQSFERAGLRNEPHSATHVVFVPKFLDGSDARVPYSYFDLLAGADLTLFPSWYEPWGYTPMESVALGIPTVTSDLTGFSDWASAQGTAEATGVLRVRRKQRSHREAVLELADHLFSAIRRGPASLRQKYEAPALALAARGTWEHQLGAYSTAAYPRALETAAHRREAKAGRAVIDSAYFSMEFAMTPELQIYSGGLGVLAGDFLKAARDLGHRVYGIGLAYREGYFKQRISPELRQEAMPAEQASFRKNGLKHITDARGFPLVFGVPLPGGRQILSGAWKLELGSSALLLLDTDVEANPPELRGLARRLYTADRRERWLQEYFLGVGGVKLLELLGIEPRWFHMNEGHTAPLAFERASALIRDRHLTFDEALSEIRRTTLFTTHTPVPAGHEEFSREISGPEIDFSAQRLRVEPDRLFELGQSRSGARDSFSLTVLALGTCARVNAVSRRHALAAERSFDPLTVQRREMFSVTNGVHPQTWISPEWQALFARQLGNDWPSALDQPALWSRVLEFDDATVWDTHRRSRQVLMSSIRDRLTRPSVGPARTTAMHRVLATLAGDPLVAVFARRFTGYKRPGLLFTDPLRVQRLVERFPKTLFVFAGKAHPADFEGQELIHRILELEGAERLMGHLLYLEDYNMADAQLLVAGADVWINVPQQPLEASGTSGMKAAMNGVLNLSVDDGWVPEAQNGEIAWRLGAGSETLGKPTMDWLHAQELYATLENGVLPLYWDRGSAGRPAQWIARMKRSIAAAIPRFSAQRMVREYAERMAW